jgi:hypothetical protein
MSSRCPLRVPVARCPRWALTFCVTLFVIAMVLYHSAPMTPVVSDAPAVSRGIRYFLTTLAPPAKSQRRPVDVRNLKFVEPPLSPDEKERIDRAALLAHWQKPMGANIARASVRINPTLPDCAETAEIVLLSHPQHRHAFVDLHNALGYAVNWLYKLKPLQQLDFPRCFDPSRAALKYGCSAAISRRPKVFVYTSYCLVGRDQPALLPSATVIWQLEPLLTTNYKCTREARMIDFLDNKIVWEYSRANIAFWRHHLQRHDTLFHHLPLYHFPGLTTAAKLPWSSAERQRRETLDVVFLGRYITIYAINPCVCVGGWGGGGGGVNVGFRV